MPFSKKEKEELLKVKGVGETVVKRLEQIGITSMQLLANSTVEEITEIVADVLQTTCWRNSPQAKKAIGDAIGCAKKYNKSPKKNA